MSGPWRALPLALLLLVAPSVLAGEAAPRWFEGGGGPDRAGVAELGAGPLDVIALAPFLAEGERIESAMGPIASPEGPLLSINAPGCELVRIDARSGATRHTPLAAPIGRPCPRVAAFVAALDAVVLCPVGSDDLPVLTALSLATGEVVWSASAVDLELHTAVPQSPGSTLPSAERWHCSNVAVDVAAREIVVPFHKIPGGQAGPQAVGFFEPGTGRNRVASVDALTGRHRWSASVPASSFAGVAPPAQSDPTLTSARDSGFEAEMVSLSSSTVLVMGSLFGTERAAAWLDRNGAVVGVAASAADPQEGGSSEASSGTVGSTWFAASGQEGAALLGERVLVVSAASPAPLRVWEVAPGQGIEEFQSRDQGGTLPSPRWHDGTLVVPRIHGVEAFSSDPLAPLWSWSPSADWHVSDTLVVPPDDLYVLAASAETLEAVLLRIDLPTGTVEQSLELPAQPQITAFAEEGFTSTRWFAGLLPLVDTGELYVWDMTGVGILLGRADPALVPIARVDDAYPAPGAEVRLTIEPPAGSDEGLLTISWGDGASEPAKAGETHEHAYAEPGLREARVTASFPDGRTATAALAIDVGGAPPVALGAIRRAVADASLDRILLVVALGLVAIVVIGEGWILAGRKRARQREGAEERRVAYERLVAREVAQGAPPEEVALRLKPLRGVLGVSDREHARWEAEARALAAAGRGGDRALVPGDAFLGRYEVERLLATGGQGRTYVCRDNRLARRVVLKVLRAGDGREAHATLEEARAFSAVRHESVVTLFDVEQVGEDVILVLELVDGGSLKDRLASGPLAPDEMTRLGDDLLCALAAVHAAGIVHRDVKPSNVLRSSNTRFKLADFGIARLAARDATADGFASELAVGTARYMSPEQARGARVDARSDLYSAAVTLHEAWTGSGYVRGDDDESVVDVRVLAAPSEAPIEGLRGPGGLRVWFEKALALDPAMRFEDALSMRAALLVALRGAEERAGSRRTDPR